MTALTDSGFFLRLAERFGELPVIAVAREIQQAHNRLLLGGTSYDHSDVERIAARRLEVRRATVTM